MNASLVIAWRFRALIRGLSLCAALAGGAVLPGCAARNIRAETAASQSHLDAHEAQLAGATRHLQEAVRRLHAQPDPQHAAQEVAAGYDQLQKAAAGTQVIRQDEAALSETAGALQQDIEAHRNDLLGPRGKRIRNRVILLAMLAAFGWSLLQIGPIFGGPVGGIAIILGHLFTAFAGPALRAAVATLRCAWTTAMGMGEWAVNQLGKLGNQSAVASVPPAMAGAITK